MTTDEKVIALNDEVTRVLLPVVIIIAFLMIVGLIGNPLVIYFYGCRMKTTPSYMFIVALALFDMLSCTISMPFEIYELMHFYTFDNADACRTLRFVNYFASIASGATLIAIAVDRYRRICKPFYWQVSVKAAKIVIGVAIGVSILFSWPSLVFFTIVRVNVTEDPELVALDCTTRRADSYRSYITIYNLILFVIFLISIAVLVVLYSLVGKQLFRLKNFRFYATSKSPLSPTKSNKSEAMTMSVSVHSPDKNNRDNREKNHNEKVNDSNNIISFSSINLEEKSNTKRPEANGDQNVTEMSISCSNVPKKIEETQIRSDSSSDEHRKKNIESRKGRKSVSSSKSDAAEKKLQPQNIDTKRYTIITLAISIAFIISFLPYLSLVTWRTIATDYEPNDLSDSGMVAFQLFVRSFLFSSACNPIIYGFLNTEFKNMVVGMCRRVFCFCCVQKDSRELSRSELSGHTGSS